jgi:ATP-dependent protease ClpP protease subunit
MSKCKHSLHEDGPDIAHIENEHFTITAEPEIIKRNRFHIRIGSQIAEPQVYTPLLNILRNAKEDDEVHLYLNTPGGDLDTCLEIVNAMAMTRATTITHACGCVASAGTIIFLAADVQIIMDNIQFMCHYYSSGFYGKGQEIEAYAEHCSVRIQKFMWKYYEGFMTKKEFKRLCKGEDYWFDSEETTVRVKNRINMLTARREKEEAEAEKEAKSATKEEKKAKKKEKEKAAFKQKVKTRSIKKS